jgi:ABC-2 type transport system permease protein
MPAWPERAELRRSYELIRELAVTGFRLRYNDSVLGYAWSLLRPLAMLVIFDFVFRQIVGVRVPGYRVYLLVGVVYWAFFQECTLSGLAALSARAGVLKSIRVAPVLVVAAGVLTSVIGIAINSLALALGLGVLGLLSPLSPWVILPLASLVMLGAGIGLLVAIAWVRFRDMTLVWNGVLQGWFWLTPVVYPLEPGSGLAEVLYLNPAARCLFLIRWFLLYDYFPSPRFIVLTVLFCAGVLALGLWMFQRRQALIPERL